MQMLLKEVPFGTDPFSKPSLDWSFIPRTFGKAADSARRLGAGISSARNGFKEDPKQYSVDAVKDVSSFVAKDIVRQGKMVWTDPIGLSAEWDEKFANQDDGDILLGYGIGLVTAGVAKFVPDLPSVPKKKKAPLATTAVEIIDETPVNTAQVLGDKYSKRRTKAKLKEINKAREGKTDTQLIDDLTELVEEPILPCPPTENYVFPEGASKTAKALRVVEKVLGGPTP